MRNGGNEEQGWSLFCWLSVKRGAKQTVRDVGARNLGTLQNLEFCKKPQLYR